MNHLRIAARLVEARRKPAREPRRVAEPEVRTAPPENILKPATEYSCSMEISLSVDFEGDVAKTSLIKKMKSEIIASLKTGMEQVAKDLGIRGTGAVIQPLKVECAVNDQADMSDDEELIPDEADFAEPDPAPDPAPRRRSKR